MSPSDDKTRQLEDLAAARDQRRRNLDVAFDTSTSVEQRLTALASLGSISDPTNVQLAIELIDNGRVDATVRAAALGKVAGYIGRDEDLIDWTAGLLADRDQPEPIRESALQVLRVNSFSSVTMLADRPRFLGTLRGLIDDPSSSIRESAIELLALNQDEYLQRRLIEGLRNPNNQITTPEKAVQLLSYDLHAEHFPVLRELARDRSNQRVRVEALRNLGADTDPESTGLLREAFADDSEDPEVRHLCGVALQRIDPAEFEAEADRIIGEERVEPELKVALLNTKLHTSGTDKNAVLETLDALDQRRWPDTARAQADRLRSLAEQKPT